MNLIEALTALKNETEAHLETTSKLLAAKNTLIEIQDDYLDLQSKYIDAIGRLRELGETVEDWDPVVFTKE